MKRRIIYINTPTLTHISMGIKHIPSSKDTFYYIIVILCEVLCLIKLNSFCILMVYM